MRISGLLAIVCAAVFAFRAGAAEIAVMRPVNACSEKERNYAASLSKHVMRWLEINGVAAELVDDTAPLASLSDKKLVYLVMCSSPNATEKKALESFVNRGGKIVSFFSTSQWLAQLMKVQLVKYSNKAAGTYAEMRFVAKSAEGEPKGIVQSSSNIYIARPIEGKSAPIAMWYSRNGGATGDAAILYSSAGWWVTHVFLGDGDEKSKGQFLAAVAGKVVPYAWNAAAWKRTEEAKRNQEFAYAAAQKPRKGEIHAVWEMSGQGLYPGNWPRTIAELRESGITDMFVNVGGAGFAHYNSAVLPKSSTYLQSGDQLQAAIRAAKGSGIRVHAWIMCFTGTKANAATMADFSKKGWRLKNKNGAELEYLDPSNPQLREYLLKAIDEIAAKYEVDGVHLDFVRWYEQVAVTESSVGAMARFHATGQKGIPALCAWRAEQIRSFIMSANSRLKAKRKAAILSTAVLAKYPSCVGSVGQDWLNWIDSGIIDYAVPMAYTDDNLKFLSWVGVASQNKARSSRIIAGLGVTANESRLTGRKVIDQVNLARRANVGGVCFFDLDYFFMHSIAPLLRVGLFRK